MTNTKKSPETSKIIIRFAHACGAEQYLPIEHKGARRALILRKMEKSYLDYIEYQEAEQFAQSCPNLLKSKNKREIPVYEGGKLIEYITIWNI